MRDLSEATAAVDSVTALIFPLVGVMFILFGIISACRIISNSRNPDDYIIDLFKGLLGIGIGTTMIVNSMGENSIVIFKYLAIAVGIIIGTGIVGSCIWFGLEVKKYYDYVKKTNKLLLLSDDFLVLSTNLDTIEKQILLNSTLIEKLNKKKKSYLTMLNSLLFEKNKRFNQTLDELSQKIVS
jgi:hypothetical protein